MSPAGEALAMLPPSVPRFWIWAAPMVAAASTRAGQVLAAEGRAANLGVRRQRPEHEGAVVEADALEGVKAREVDHPLGQSARARR